MSTGMNGEDLELAYALQDQRYPGYAEKLQDSLDQILPRSVDDEGAAVLEGHSVEPAPRPNLAAALPYLAVLVATVIAAGILFTGTHVVIAGAVTVVVLAIAAGWLYWMWA